MAKRASGPPRRPRNPVAKAVRAPLYRQRVIPDKRREARQRDGREEENGNGPEAGREADEIRKNRTGKIDEDDGGAT